MWGNIGRVQYLYAGEGDLTEVKLGIGWEVVKRVSIGVAAQYYWGDIERTYQTVVSNNIVNGGSVNTVTGTDSYGISRIKMQLGLQADLIQSERQVLTLGATYDMAGNLRPSVNQTVVNGDIYGTVVRGDTTRMALKLPVQLGVGLYYQNAKIAAASTTSTRTGRTTSRRSPFPERSTSPIRTRTPSSWDSSIRPTGWISAIT